MIVPSYWAMASWRISWELMSRWLVGSSSSIRLAGRTSMRASATRDFSPPLSTRTCFSTSSPVNRKAPSRERTWVMVMSTAV